MSDLTPEAQAIIRRLARQVNGLKKDVRDMQRASQGAFRGVHLDDQPVQFFDGNQNLAGALQQSTGGGVILVPSIGEAPPQPTMPGATSTNEAIRVTWDGSFVGVNRPNDLARVEIHKAVLDDEFIPTDQTLCGEFTSPDGGEKLIAADPYVAFVGDLFWYFRLVAVDLAGNRSIPSDSNVSRALPTLVTIADIIHGPWSTSIPSGGTSGYLNFDSPRSGVMRGMIALSASTLSAGTPIRFTVYANGVTSPAYGTLRLEANLAANEHVMLAGSFSVVVDEGPNWLSLHQTSGTSDVNDWGSVFGSITPLFGPV